MTQIQATTLAHLVNSIRPDWDKPGIIAECRRVADRDPVAVSIAMLSAAKDPGAETPGAIRSAMYWAGWGQPASTPTPGRPTRDPKFERFKAEMDAAAATAATRDEIDAILAGTPWARRDAS